MSAKVTRLVVNALRNSMYPALPTDIQKMFPMVRDPFSNPPNQNVPNIMPGHYEEYGANTGLVMITVYSDGANESLIRQYKHLTLYIDIWVSAAQSPNVDGRRLVDILYEYVRRAIQETNYSGDQVSIHRSYELVRSPVLFEPTNKIYHIANTYRVEAVSQSWY